jgi:hypothetical protein
MQGKREEHQRSVAGGLGRLSISLAMALGLCLFALASASAMAPDLPAGCNGDVRQKATPGPLGYSERRDGGDPRCEGLYQREVAADNLPEIAPVSLVLRTRPFTPADDTVIALAWPHVPAPVALCARHTGNSIFYRMDAVEEPHESADRAHPACDEFRWHTGVLGRIAGEMPGFDLAHLRVLAQVTVPLSGETAERFPDALRGKMLLLPLLVNAPEGDVTTEGTRTPNAATPDQQADSPAAPANSTVRLALAFHTNRELRNVILRCSPLNPESGQPIVREFPVAPRGIFAVRNLDIPTTGGYWSVEIVFRFHHQQEWKEDRSLFYIMAPNAQCAAWGAPTP